jgi:large subunit ribosomal protein L19e
MIVKGQRRIAAELLGVGRNKVWFDKNKLEDIKKAITRLDIKELIKDNTIKAMPNKKRKKASEKGRRGVGKRKMKVANRKQRYVRKIRKLRRYIQEMKSKDIITNEEKKKLRKMARAGELKSLRHLQDHLVSMNKKLPERKTWSKK